MCKFFRGDRKLHHYRKLVQFADCRNKLNGSCKFPIVGRKLNIERNNDEINGWGKNQRQLQRTKIMRSKRCFWINSSRILVRVTANILVNFGKREKGNEQVANWKTSTFLFAVLLLDAILDTKSGWTRPWKFPLNNKRLRERLPCRYIGTSEEGTLLVLWKREEFAQAKLRERLDRQTLMIQTTENLAVRRRER